MKATSAAAVLAYATTAMAQGFGGYSGGNPYDGGNNNGPYGGGSAEPNFAGFHFSHYQVAVFAHAVMATVAVAFLFPVGGILIRLGSFRGVWIVHGIFQILSYLVYIAAVGVGIYLVTSSPVEGLITHSHPIIGLVLLAVLFFQPLGGFLHHLSFKKTGQRGFWSYGHIWLGRAAITLGIVNGGLGLQLAGRYPLAPPSVGVVVGYSIGAGVMWLVYVLCVIIGERRRIPNGEPDMSELKGQYS